LREVERVAKPAKGAGFIFLRVNFLNSRLYGIRLLKEMKHKI